MISQNWGYKLSLWRGLKCLENRLENLSSWKLQHEDAQTERCHILQGCEASSGHDHLLYCLHHPARCLSGLQVHPCMHEQILTTYMNAHRKLITLCSSIQRCGFHFHGKVSTIAIDFFPRPLISIAITYPSFPFFPQHFFYPCVGLVHTVFANSITLLFYCNGIFE